MCSFSAFYIFILCHRLIPNNLTLFDIHVITRRLNLTFDLRKAHVMFCQPLQRKKQAHLEEKKAMWELEVAEIIAAFTEKVIAYEHYCANQSYSLHLLDELRTVHLF